jgi:hypothetical protein
VSEPRPFDYAVIRVVPHEGRGEFINAGVILFCPGQRFLEARIACRPERLAALAPGLDTSLVRHHLEAIPRICAGGAPAGILGDLSQAERFRWLVAPRNTIIQTSAVHSGLTSDPTATLERLFAEYVP